MVSILGMVGSAYWSHLHTTLRQARYQANSEVAFHLAEAGVAHGVALLRAGVRTPEKLEKQALGEGQYSFSLQPESDGVYTITGMGELVDGAIVRARREVVARVRVEGDGRVVAFALHPKRK